MDELSKRDADALGVDDLTGPQLRHQERIAKAIANGMPPSGRHG